MISNNGSNKQMEEPVVQIEAVDWKSKYDNL